MTTMRHFTTLGKQTAYFIACMAMLFITGVSFGQKVKLPLVSPLRPNLGTATTYAIFTGGGAINNTGLSVLTGDVGQDGAHAFNGFPPGTYTGTLNRNNGASAIAKADLITAQTANAAVPCGFVLGVGIVDGQSFDPAVYCSGGATTTTGNITFDAHGDASAIFIVKIGGALSANSGTNILLANGAQAGNIYWFVDGAVDVANNSSFKGTIVANGAITFQGTSSLDGRALVAPAGAINISANNMSIPGSGSNPGGNIMVTKPALGDTVKGGTQNYQITWTGTGIGSIKTIEYSLDSGLTWRAVGTATGNVFTFNWNVPDTSSKKAKVRITDQNNIRGISGLFIIGSSKIIVVKPAMSEKVTGGTQNYQITWTGTGLTLQKTFEYSLDSGLTWITIGTSSADANSYNWNVPDVASTKAMVRITDQKGTTGKSSVFTIRSSKITVTRPTAGEVLTGGMQNFQIMWTGIGLGDQKTFELSLDSGLTWKTIGTTSTDVSSFYWNVPDTASTKAIIRITDQNGITGKSGVFAIKKSTPNPGSIAIYRPAFGEVINANTQNYQIMWTGNALAQSKTIELSLDGGLTWKTIGTITSDASTFFWNVPDTASSNAVIRITDQNGITGMSGIFTIKASTPDPVGSIVLTHPVGGEVIDGGTQNFLINFTAVNTTLFKRLEYSLDGGATWTLIGIMNSDAQTYTWSTVPNVATTQALVRITDANGVTGTSGLFTIKVTPGVGSINTLTLSGLNNRNNIGNNKILGISWTYTPEIGTSVVVEYSLDYMVTWSHIATVPVAELSSTSWITTPTGYYNPVFIRVTSSLGMTRTSIAFSIGTSSSVSSDASENGYAISNYPNPAVSNTTISLVLPIASDVTLKLIDALGRTVGTSIAQRFEAGVSNIPYNTSSLDAGIYTYVLQAGSTRLVGKMNIIR